MTRCVLSEPRPGIELRLVHNFCHEILLGRLFVGSLRLEVSAAQAGSGTSTGSLSRGAGRPSPGSRLACSLGGRRACGPEWGSMPPRPRWAPSSPCRSGAATEKPLLMGTRDSTMHLSWWRTPGPPLPGPHRWAGSVKTLRQQRMCTENQSSEKPERPPKTPTQPLAPSGSVCSVTPAGSTPGSAPSLPRPPAAAHLPVPSAPQTPHLSSHLWWEPLDGSPKLPRSVMPHLTVRPGDLSEEGRDTASFGLAAPSSGSGSPLPPLLPSDVSGPSTQNLLIL